MMSLRQRLDNDVCIQRTLNVDSLISVMPNRVGHIGAVQTGADSPLYLFTWNTRSRPVF